MSGTVTIPLNSRVRLRETKDITGVVVSRTEHRDGTESYGVQYWHGGDRCTMECEAVDLEVVE